MLVQDELCYNMLYKIQYVMAVWKEMCERSKTRPQAREKARITMVLSFCYDDVVMI
jgi:hypothetical protein